MGDFQDGEVLIASLQKGEEEAFVYIFEAYYGRLLNYSGRIIRDEELAHDLVQEAYCRLFEVRQTLDTRLSIQAYLYKSVYNNCMNAIKHRKIEHNYIDQELLDFYFTEIVQTPEAELKLLDEDMRLALQEAIEKLPARCREVFILKKIEDLSNKEIAERLGISVKTVEAQMTKALAKLREELEWLLCFIFIANF